MLIDSVAAALGGAAGGFVLSRSLDKTSRSHRLTSIAISGFIGHYVGYITALYVLATYEWIQAGSEFMVAGASGFITGAVIPAIYQVFLNIAKQVGSNPKEWLEFFLKLFKVKS